MQRNEVTTLNSKQHGLSLVEVLVAIFIISIGVVLFGYFAKSLKTTSDARLETNAMISMRNVLDDTRALWATPQYFNSGELPYSVKAPSGYSNFAIVVSTVGVADSSHNFSCTYDYLEASKRFENNCGVLGSPDYDSLIRHVEIQLSGNQTDILKLSMQLARPVE